MAELHATCPDCGSLDLVTSEVIVAESKEVRCPNCSWTGPAAKTVGVASSEDFWTIERVGAVLLRVMAKHAAGPLCQVFEFVGLLEKDDQAGRDVVMQAATAGCITAAFEAAHSVHLERLKNKSEEDLTELEKATLRGSGWTETKN